MRECDHKFIDSRSCLKCGWMPPPHAHTWSLRERIDRAEIDVADPVAHTGFMLLQCSCGAVTAFPLENYAMTTARYKEGLGLVLLTEGRFFDPGES